MSRFDFTFQQDSEDNTGGGDGLPNRLKKHDQWLVTQDKKPVVPSKGWQESVNHLTFTEVSSSATGLHVIAEGDHLDDRKHRGDLSESGHLEVYDGFTSVESRPTVVRDVQDDYLPERLNFSFTSQQTPVSGQKSDGEKTGATPEQVRRTIRAYVKTDSHDVDQEVLRLWQGSNEGRPSPSEADMAFVKQLYYWCKGDQQLMDECFRASGRMRPKCDEQRGDQTYGEMTIRKVCRTNGETFGGRYVERG